MAANDVRYLSLPLVIALNTRIMDETDSPQAPLRAEGLLESAIMRAHTAAYYDQADLLRQAAVLAVGITQAQAFVDGNKRLAFGAMDVFLRLNGCRFVGETDDAVAQFEALARGTDSLQAAPERFEAWLRNHTVPLEKPPGAGK